MAIQKFSSFEAFFGANRHADLRAMLLGPERRSWVLTHLLVNGLSVQLGEASGRAVVEGASKPGGITIFIQTQGASSFSGNGRRLDDQSLMVVDPGTEFCLASDATPRRWCSIYIPTGLLEGETGTATSTVGARRGVFQTAPAIIEAFRSAIKQLDDAVREAPDAFTAASAQKPVEQKLIQAIRGVLGTQHHAKDRVGRHEVPRKQIIRSSIAFVDQHDGEYLSVEQLAASAGISERTLREAFQQYFGVPPVQYLNRRTLHQVRKALKAANSSGATVTGIFTQFGVWQFGRFARDYRALFGELPSETLRHPR